MHPVFCIFDIGTGPKLMRTDVLEQSWLDNFHQCNILQIQSALDTKLVVSVTVTAS